MELLNASVLVVGASGALGSAITRRLADSGAKVTAVGRRVEALDELTASCPAGAVHAIVGDLRSSDVAQKVVHAAVEHGGQLQLVVNAVGVVAFGDVAELESDVLEELFLTNVFSSIFVAQAALPVMAAGSTLASISGVIAERNMPGMAAYGASKAALRSFNEGFAREARRRKVRVLDIRPPHTETGLVDRAIAGTAPKFPEGLSTDSVADTIVASLLDPTITDVPASTFGT